MLKLLFCRLLSGQAAEAVTAEQGLIESCHEEGGHCLQGSRVSQRPELSPVSKVTVVLNHWQRPAANLQGQLRASTASAAVLEVWVCLFGSSQAEEYQAVVEDFRSEGTEAKVKLIRSEVDFGVYGRFFLAAFAKTKYVYVVDDDVAFPVTAVDQYLRHMQKQPGVWGHAGHVRSTKPDSARWIDRPKKPTVVDYANAAWFLEVDWITGAFLREKAFSFLTGEDMHLSYMVKKILGLETRVVGWRRDKHPFSRYRLGMVDQTTLTAPIFSFRSFLVRAQMGRGPVMRRSPIDTLAYVDTPQEAQTLCCEDRCGAQPGCTMLLFSGLQDRRGLQDMEAVGRALCPGFTPYEMCGEVCAEMGFAGVSSLNLRASDVAGCDLVPSRWWLSV
ncbi:unnamed protein product [Effrenium voratum]|uniref:Glycosyltransferase 2-like domain-containing protein n=1 Tax=Effrenium voratum TaxID=2562239 RepID=A0AA36MPN9_9DINO|nr:unnamed protein product [Effrenium voratum]CAJ1414378.1 unnamed protein product [Effrenium voratum]